MQEIIVINCLSAALAAAEKIQSGNGRPLRSGVLPRGLANVIVDMSHFPFRAQPRVPFLLPFDVAPPGMVRRRVRAQDDAPEPVLHAAFERVLGKAVAHWAILELGEQRRVADPALSDDGRGPVLVGPAGQDGQPVSIAWVIATR